jgi:hypothetical protein
VVELAEGLPEAAWKPLERLVRYEIATEPRRKPQRIKPEMTILRYFSIYRLGYEGVSPLDFSRARENPVSLVSCRQQKSTPEKA